ncbi:MAG: bifunctional phosphoglucose/phosphomannose isomerase [Candidatus Zixiibacteriota bacterium]
MSVLDDQNGIKKIDARNMYELIYNFPSQLQHALKIARELTLPSLRKDEIKNIILTGMGGSAIGGDLIRSYLSYEFELPFFICRNYTLPHFVDKNSLVFVSSYSGNTEETLSAYRQAKKIGAKIISISSDGELLKLSERDGFPFLKIPPGYPPRAALGYSFVPIFVFLERLGFVSGKIKDFEKTIQFLSSRREKYSFKISSEKNIAKNIADELFNKLPIIYSGADHFDAVAYRWKGQICENSKMLCFNNVFPEFNHNELVGWEILSGMEEKIVVVLLEDQKDHPQIKRRMEIVKGIIQKKGAKVIELESEGENLLSRIFSLIQLGDFVSFYLAVLNQVDPTPVKLIDYLKSELAK